MTDELKVSVGRDQESHTTVYMSWLIYDNGAEFRTLVLPLTLCAPLLSDSSHSKIEPLIVLL
ncbi:hypothetical protein RchiOBHm_Chr1g0373581 [Rosa chinensis]|uniref:Uncharacterized protein n=1 Tax=Rosa chinensis TaxID=74649 RepID=A0A2P6SM36_ROSCH|nr:hypothetical protein RchiOBHm_Chr1g0373581 [Rosa chinensis]